MAERTTNTELLKQLFSYTSFPVIFYELEIKDNGTGTFTSSVLTDASNRAKTWIINEWATNTAYLVDKDNTKYPIVSNTATTITIDTTGYPTPVNGEYSIHRWFYLTQHAEEYYKARITEAYEEIEFGIDSLSRPKYYLPYPIKHQTLEDTELGKFPQIILEVLNPGTQLMADYYGLSDFDFYSHLERYKGLQGNIVNVYVAFINSDGQLITDPDVSIKNSYIISKTQLSNKIIRFTINNFGNLADKKIPSRVFTKNTCSFVYKDINCAYSTTYLDKDTELIIPTCNKTLRSYVFGNSNSSVQLTKVSGSLVDQTYYLTSIMAPTTAAEKEEFINVLTGAMVEYKQVPYLWRITSVDADVDPVIVEIKSYEPFGADLASIIPNYHTTTINTIEVAILEKECCIGHNDSGNKNVYSNFKFEDSNAPFYCYPNDLIYNGDFTQWLDVVPVPVGQTPDHINKVDGWDINIGDSSFYDITNMADSVLYIDATEEDNLIMNQTCYDRTKIPLGTYPTQKNQYLLEHGKAFNLIINHYTAINSEETGTFSYKLVVYQYDNATYRSWNNELQTWVNGSYYNELPIHPYSERLGFTIGNDMDYSIFRFIKFDSLVHRIPFVEAFTTYLHEKPILTITLYLKFSGVTSLLDYVSLQQHNQSERYGGFPSIPTSKYWFL